MTRAWWSCVKRPSLFPYHLRQIGVLFLPSFFASYLRATLSVIYKISKVNFAKNNLTLRCYVYFRLNLFFIKGFSCFLLTLKKIAVSFKFMFHRLKWSITFSSYVSMRWNTEIISWNQYVNKTTYLWIIIYPKRRGLWNLYDVTCYLKLSLKDG